MSNENDPFSLSSKNLKMDLLHFKDDILKDIKEMQKNISDKFNISNNILKEKLESYDTKLNLYNEKIVQLSNLIIEDKNLGEKVNKLIANKTTFEENILTHDIRIKNMEKNFSDKISQINDILSESVIYPNVIGGISKLKTFHDFIDYVLMQIAQINTYKEKNTLDLSTYKNKLENLIKSLQMQLDNIIKSTNEFTTKSVNECEERIKNIFSIYDERFQNVRIENSSYAINLEQYYKDLKEEFKKFNNIKNNIINKFNNEVNNMKKDNYQVVKIFGNYKKEFNLMKDRLTRLSEFIKDVRFRKNLMDVKRKEFVDLGNKLDFNKKQNYEISSEIKKYIRGEINAEDLVVPKKYSRSNVNIFEEDINKKNDNLISSYLSKNSSFRSNYINNDFNKLEQISLKNKNEFSNIQKRKSVYNLMTPFSLKDYKINSQRSSGIINFSQNNKLDINPELSKQNQKPSLSSDVKIRKRYTSFMSENNNIISQLKNLDSAEKFKYNNNQSPIIKEELEAISNSSESIYSEITPKNSSKTNNSKENKKINKEKIQIPKINSNLQQSEEQKIINNNLIEKIPKINFEKIKDYNIIEKKEDSKPNNIIIDCNKKNNIKEDKNIININSATKTNIVTIIANNNEGKNILKNNNNNKENIKDRINQEISSKKIIKLIKPNNDDIMNKEKNYIKKTASSDNSKKNNGLNNLTINKIVINNQVIKDAKFAKTINNFSLKKNNIFIKEKEKEKTKKLIDDYQNFDENKSFKGKKYQNLTNSLVMKVKENLIFDSINRDKDINTKKNMSKENNKNFFHNNSNMISFNLDEDSIRKGKDYYSSAPSERNKDAKQIQKMVNNLRSYIINYNNNLNETNLSRHTFYSKGNNVSLKDLNNSYKTQNNGKYGNIDNNSQTNRENVINLNLK